MSPLGDESTPRTKAHSAYVWARHSLNQAAALLESLRKMGANAALLDAATFAFEQEEAEYLHAVTVAIDTEVWTRRREGDK